MKTVLVIVSVLALAHLGSAQKACSNIPDYNTTFVPQCAGDDVYVLWPNYENFTEYYRCQGVGNPKMANCAGNTYFSYYLQVCTTCEDYIPAPACEYLKTSKTPNCVANGATTAPPTTTTTVTVTATPTTTVTAAPTTTTTAKVTVTTTTTTPPPTTTTPSGVPQPPSPSTVNPDIPTPPTPAPTPPTVAPNPPSEAPPA